MKDYGSFKRSLRSSCGVPGVPASRGDPVSETGSSEERPNFRISTNSGMTVKLEFLDDVSFMDPPAVNHAGTQRRKQMELI